MAETGLSGPFKVAVYRYPPRIIPSDATKAAASLVPTAAMLRAARNCVHAIRSPGSMLMNQTQRSGGFRERLEDTQTRLEIALLTTGHLPEGQPPPQLVKHVVVQGKGTGEYEGLLFEDNHLLVGDPVAKGTHGTYLRRCLDVTWSVCMTPPNPAFFGFVTPSS